MDVMATYLEQSNVASTYTYLCTTKQLTESGNYSNAGLSVISCERSLNNVTSHCERISSGLSLTRVLN